METEAKICARYGRELELIAALDRAYHFHPVPTSAERAKYQKRQEELETLRAQFYTELDRFREEYP
jgi:hypothetical protein